MVVKNWNHSTVCSYVQSPHSLVCPHTCFPGCFPLTVQSSPDEQSFSLDFYLDLQEKLCALFFIFNLEQNIFLIYFSL